MTRIILIERNTGYIWGDSADFNGKLFTDDDAVQVRPSFDGSVDDFALAYAEALEQDIDPSSHGQFSHEYYWSSRSDNWTYAAYRADGDKVPTVWDGQSSEEIQAVMDFCDEIGFITSECVEEI
jgi:hypothetical protein